MKFLNFLFLAAIISCDKKPETFNQKSIEENCFQIVKVGKETPKKQYVEPSKEDILQNFPKHIHFVTNEHKNSFENVLKHNEIEIKKYFYGLFCLSLSPLSHLSFLSRLSPLIDPYNLQLFSPNSLC